jgi:hypothetical protein
MINTACVQIRYYKVRVFQAVVPIKQQIWYHVDNEMWDQVDDQGVDQVWWTLYEYGNNVFE